MFDHDECIIVLAQRLRHRTDVVLVDTPFARDCKIEGKNLQGLLKVLRHGHLRTVRDVCCALRVECSMSVEDANELLEGLFGLHLITTNRRMALTMEEISMNPSGMPLAPRTIEDLLASHVAIGSSHEVDLPKNATSLMELVSRRSSVRSFTDQEIQATNVDSLARVAYGTWGSHRSIPSAGGLYPCNVHMFIRRGDEYVTLNQRHLSIRRIKQMFVPNAPCQSAPLYVVLTADYDRATKKYGTRGWRYAMLEAGHIAQNFSLHALEIGISTCEIGAFKDLVCARNLQLKEMEIPLIVIGCGYAAQPDKTSVKNSTLSAKLLAVYGGSTGIISSLSLKKRDAKFFPELFSIQAQAAAPIAHRGMGMDLQSVGGEAKTYELATVKAVAEGVERFSTGWIPQPMHRSVIGSLKGSKIIRPSKLQKYDHVQKIPSHIKLFTPASVADWYEVKEWNTGRKTYVLGDFLFYPYGKDGQKLYSYATSNGVAAHVNKENALWKATAELLERESLLAWWFSGTIPPQLPKDECEHLSQFVKSWETKGVELRFLDITTSIPTVCAVALNRRRRLSCFATASGSSFHEAVTHACSEVLRSVARFDHKDVKKLKPEQVRSVEDHLNCFASGYGFAYADTWSSGKVVNATRDQFPNTTSPKVWLRWVIDNVGSVLYYGYSLPKRMFPDQPLVVVRSIIPGVVSVKFGYGEQDLGLPRLQQLMRQCQSAGTAVGYAIPKIHPLA